MSSVEISSRISHNIMVNMYTKKPYINKNGDMIFRKNGILLFGGILLFLIFFSFIFCLDTIISEIMEENNISIYMTDKIYIGSYILIALFILLGINLIVMFFKHRIIISKDSITSKKLFSTKTIRLFDVEAITFSNRSGLVFRGGDYKIKFGNFTNGLIEALKFIDENFPKYKHEQAVEKAKKMLRNNRIIY